MRRIFFNKLEGLAKNFHAPLFGLCAFTLPLSSSLKSIFFPWAIINLLCISEYRQLLKKIFFNHTMVLFCLLFLLAFLGLFYTPATFNEQMMVFLKYSKLIYFPFFVVGFHDPKARNYALTGFFAAMTVTFFVATLRHFNYFSEAFVSQDLVFRNHIIMSFMMSFAAYMAFFRIHARATLSNFMYIGLFMLCTTYVFFISGGRMGYLCYMLLLVHACWVRFPTYIRLAAVSSCFILLSLVYCSSASFQTRIHETVQEMQWYQQNKSDTSIGYRFQFHSFAKSLWLKHPLIGNGTGSYGYYFRVLRPFPSWQGDLLEPHSQYWFFLVEYGVFGLTLFLLILFSMYRDSFLLGDEGKLLRGLIYAFCLVNLTDSMFFYSGPGFFFLFMSAYFMGGLSLKKEPNFCMEFLFRLKSSWSGTKTKSRA